MHVCMVQTVTKRQDCLHHRASSMSSLWNATIAMLIKPWYVASRGPHLEFATALEAEYPRLLCQRMAQCLVRAAQAAQVTLGPSLKSSQLARHAWGSQTTRSKPLFCQFKEFVHLDQSTHQPSHVLLASPLPGDQNTESLQEHEEEPNPKRVRKMFKYGVQWEPAEFLEQAKQLKHPKDPQAALPIVLKETMVQILSRDPLEVAKHRLQVVLAIHRKSTTTEGRRASSEACHGANGQRSVEVQKHFVVALSSGSNRLP